ncbi:MAG: hypothetical protein KF754_15305 [Planctomycetes bacterium]|nr:hypothetical protein [Planctomycetota bacterium]
MRSVILKGLPFLSCALVLVVSCVGVAGGVPPPLSSSEGGSLRSPAPWSRLTIEGLKEAESRSGGVYAELKQYPWRAGRPAANEYLGRLTKNRKPHASEIDDLKALGANPHFWGCLLYIVEHSHELEPLELVALVWRSILRLPASAPYEELLLIAGGGPLMQMLLSGEGPIKDSPMGRICAPFGLETANANDLDGLWGYFTGYGGDATIDPIVRLDYFAAFMDLDPLWRAAWRKSPHIMELEKKFNTWGLDQRWNAVISARNARKVKVEVYLKLRRLCLDGSINMSPGMFDGD